MKALAFGSENITSNFKETSQYKMRTNTGSPRVMFIIRAL
jgi:hypothetical protein